MRKTVKALILNSKALKNQLLRDKQGDEVLKEMGNNPRPDRAGINVKHREHHPVCRNDYDARYALVSVERAKNEGGYKRWDDPVLKFADQPDTCHQIATESGLLADAGGQ